jgi:HK97 family phage portal protein
MTQPWSLAGWLGQRIGLGSSFRKFWATFVGRDNWSNEVVTLDRALQIAAFWRGIKLTAETVASLPKNVFAFDKPGEPIRDANNAYDALIRISPNEDYTPVEFWEVIVAAMCVLGNGYAKKMIIGDRLIGLQLVDQGCTYPYRTPQNFQLRYKGKDLFGRDFDVPAAEMYHLKGFNFGGDAGLSLISYGAQSLGMTLAANKTAGRLFAAGMNTSGFLETAATLQEDDRERLTKIMADYMGSDNAGKMMILEGGMKWNGMTMKPIDAQLLATMGFNIEEIGRWLEMPPVLLGHNASGQTMWGTGVESIISAWYTLGLRGKLTRIESSIQKRLLMPADRQKYFVRFSVDGLLRGDSAAQAALFSAAAQNGWLTRNEIRKLLDLPPMAGGDELTVQVNMTLLRDLGSNNTNQVAAARNALLNLLGLDADAGGRITITQPAPKAIAAPADA